MGGCILKIKSIIYKIAKKFLSTEQWEHIERMAYLVVWDRHGGISREIYDDYSASTAVIVESLMHSVWGGGY